MIYVELDADSDSLVKVSLQAFFLIRLLSIDVCIFLLEGDGKEPT